MRRRGKNTLSYTQVEYIKSHNIHIYVHTHMIFPKGDIKYVQTSLKLTTSEQIFLKICFRNAALCGRMTI